MEHKRKIYQGRRIELYQKEILDAEGEKHLYDCVLHPGAVVILPYLDENTILLIRNQRVVIEKPLIELPAGTLEKGALTVSLEFI